MGERNWGKMVRKNRQEKGDSKEEGTENDSREMVQDLRKEEEGEEK